MAVSSIRLMLLSLARSRRVLSPRMRTSTMLMIACLLTGCGGSNDSEPAVDPLDRAPMLAHWADNIIIPSYEKFEVKLDAMIARADAFAATPTTVALSELRVAWAEAYTEWQRVELFEFGPGDRNTIRNFFNIYPADVTGIIQNFDDPAANLALPAAYARQGFPALDYLINGLAENDEYTIALYTTDPDAAKRLAYLNRLTSRMKSILDAVISDWKGGYRNTFVNQTGLDIGSSTSNVVNSYVLNYERFIRSGKIGIPSGAMTSNAGVKYPEKVEAYYKRNLSLSLAKAAHKASVDFFNGISSSNGTSGFSLKSYLDLLGAEDASTAKTLSQLINDQFVSVDEKLGELDNDLHKQILTDNQSMIDTYDEMQQVVRMLKVDMTSAMSITITYTDNDGD